MEDRYIQLVLNDVVNRELKGAGLSLIGVINHHHFALARIIRDEVWHRAGLSVGLSHFIKNDRGLLGFYTASTFELSGTRLHARLLDEVLS